MPSSFRPVVLIGLLVLLPTSPLRAENYVAVLRYSPTPATHEQVQRFVVPTEVHRIAYAHAAQLRGGLVRFELIDPRGKTIYAQSASVFTAGPNVLRDVTPGRYELRIVATNAVGRWQTSVAPVPPTLFFKFQLAGSMGMILVAIAAVIVARRRFGASWRWLGVGATVWAVGVALKMIVAIGVAVIPMSTEALLPRGIYLAAGSVYMGVMTGVFEVGVTAVAALIWRKWTIDASRAAAIGFGAGAIEALLLGLGQVAISALVVFNPTQVPDGVTGGMALLLAATPVAWLIGPTERVIAIACHAGSRMGALFAVARGRWLPFWVGFSILTLVDAAVGAAHVSQRLGMFSMWWIELAILPFALIAAAVIGLCMRRWPRATEPRQPAPERDENYVMSLTHCTP
jgi:uncharacterized membrane protein YhfC